MIPYYESGMVQIKLNAEYIEIAKRRLRQETFEFTPEGELSAT